MKAVDVLGGDAVSRQWVQSKRCSLPSVPVALLSSFVSCCLFVKEEREALLIAPSRTSRFGPLAFGTVFLCVV